jgi:hypothetical protein
VKPGELRRGRFAAFLRRKSLWNPVGTAMILPGIVLKRHHALTFLATIGIDLPAMKFLAVISILALLTMGGAAISDQFLTADQHAAHGVE